jgi:hypothetical protein
VASLNSSGGFRVAVQAARTSDFASFDLNLQSNGGALLYGGNEVATRSWVTGQSYITGISFANVSSKPTTLSGYGITDALPLAGGTMTGIITTVSSGTAINFSGQSDSFGYNATSGQGTYIKGTGSTYVYGGGTFFDGSTVRVLLHSGNFTSYAMSGAGYSANQNLNTNSNVTFTGESLTATLGTQATRQGKSNLLIDQYLETNFDDTGVYYAIVVTSNTNNTAFQSCLINFILES